MKKYQPKNLNLLTIRFPMPAIVSILHRISGFILFLAIPLLLWGLNHSLASQQDFDTVHQFLTTPLIKWIVWGVMAALLYHLTAGIRHLLMDIHIGESLKSGRIAAYVTIIFSLILIVLTGIWLW